MTESDINAIKASIYFDLAEMLRRQDLIGCTGFGARDLMRRELLDWANAGGKDPDEEEV